MIDAFNFTMPTVLFFVRTQTLRVVKMENAHKFLKA